ncbi:MAG: c-type cytochrome [Verrucomicrobia bacterium]|nr:c-type cytochrome [Verrucomicrobiota bacterium]
MHQFPLLRWLAALAVAAEISVVAQPAPKTRVTYSEAYGKSGSPPELTAKDMPRFPAVEPTNAAATFQVKKGFRLELVASEPLVNSPVTMAFDEHGRLFVVEMIDYSERRDETPHAGRIRLLEDTDGDGKFDKSTVFADNLPWPTALICYGGGIFIGATPDIIWLKDTNGDGKADERKVVFTGFGSGATRLNVQALINSFNWGLDNRIHGATGPIGGNEVRSTAAKAGPALDLRGRDFSFDPRSMGMQAESGGGQYGMSFDSLGRKFVCSNSDHLQMVLFGLRYPARNSAFPMPSPRISIAADGPAAEVFRLSPDEPWRVVRTRWRISGVVPGGVEGGGRVSGYFTGATGATIYRGNAYGPEFVDNAFIGDAGGNLVHRKILSPNGVALTGKRPADEQGMEFLASRDTWFRPVHFQNAPDGCLYIADMYREVIEHPWSIPESIKKHIDLNSGNNRGRIWRIVPENFQQPKPPKLAAATTVQLVSHLDSPNGWTRDTAARLLYERQDRRAVAELDALLGRSRSALGRMHALHALQGLFALETKHLVAGLADSDERVREHAVRLSEAAIIGAGGSGPLAAKLLGMTGDLSPRVRQQLAFTLGDVRSPARPKALADIIRRDVESTWMQAAVLSSLTDGAGEVFTTLAHDVRFRSTPGHEEFLRKLVELIGARNSYSETRAVLEFVAKPDSQAPIALIVRALGDGAARAGTTLAVLDKLSHLKGVFASAAQTAVDEKAPERARVQAVQLLALTSHAQSGAKLVQLLDAPAEPLRLAALGALARFPAPEVGGELVRRWASFSPRARTDALAALTTRPERALVLLKAVEAGTVKLADLPAATVKTLQSNKDKSVASLAARLFPPAPKPADVLKTFRPALDLRGDAARGKVLFMERCASCHRADTDGFALGPDFVTVKTAGKEKLLASIVDPNAEIAPQFIAFQVDTKDDESYTAVIGNETPSNVTLRMASGQEVTIPRTKVKGMKSSGQSLMPENLTAGLTPSAMADLLEFIMTAPAPK